MTVKYKVVTRGNPANPDAPKKFYPSVSSSGRITLRQLSQRIADISTVSQVDTMAVLEGLVAVLPEAIADGNIVNLGDFGSFWLRIKSEGAETEAGVNAKSIVNVLPKFTPGKEFRQVLKNTEFKKGGSE